MKLLMTSNGFYTDEIKEQFMQLISGNPAALHVAIITTASPLKENNGFARKARDDFRGMGFADIDFLDVEFENPSILAGKDVIYINGGNPFTLLHHLKRSGADQVLRGLMAEDVVVVGASAGAVVLGPHIKVVKYFTPHMDTFHSVDLTALHLTSRLIFPHYDREDLFRDGTNRTIEERLKDFETIEGCEVTRLKDDGWILDMC